MIRRGRIVVRKMRITARSSKLMVTNNKEEDRWHHQAALRLVPPSPPQHQHDTGNSPVLRDLANTTDNSEGNTMVTTTADVHHQTATKAVVDPCQQ